MTRPHAFRRARSAAVLAVAALLATATVANQPGRAAADTTAPVPAKDPFYASPANIASYGNGAIIRTRSVPATVSFVGTSVPLSAWQLAYRSNDAANKPITAVTTILVPTAAWTGGTPLRPLVAYQAAEDSLGSQCAPSYSLETGSNILTGQEQSLMAEALMKGFALDVSDYEGMNSAYLVGPQAAHIALDGIRAAQHFPTAGLSTATPVGIWGYSGGGHATAWAAELQHSYAPDLKVAGVAFGGAPYNLNDSLKASDGGPYTGFAVGSILGVHNGYPQWNLWDQLNAKGKTAFGAAEGTCIADFATNFVFAHVGDYFTSPNALQTAANQKYVNIGNLGQHVPVAPIYDYYSLVDEAIPTADSEALVAKYCGEGVKVIAQPVALSEHVTLAITKTPDVLDFLLDRFTNKPLTGVCS